MPGAWGVVKEREGQAQETGCLKDAVGCGIVCRFVPGGTGSCQSC